MLTKQKQIEEIIKCGKEPSYFLKTYVKIQHPKRGLIPFKTYPFQDDCVTDFNDHRFNVVLKSRQMGLSTLVAGYATWMAIFHKDQSILIIATKQKVAQNIIRKMRTIVNNLPSWLFITKVTGNNKQEIEFSNGSVIKAVPTSEDAGRSEALSLLIIDEAAHIRNFDDLWTSLYSTLSTGGRAIVLSTPKGVGGKYHELYTQAEAGLNEFHPIKLMWNLHPEHDQAWFDNECRNLTPKEVSQEILCDFLASGDTFLNHDDINWLNEFITPPIERLSDDKNLWLWKYSLADHKYIISADVSRGDASDFSTFHVIDATSCEVVAEYKGKMRPDTFADLLIATGRKYNNALICPEVNNFGYAVCMKIRENEYPALYYQNSKNNFYLGTYNAPQDQGKMGFDTQGHNRPKILSKLEEVIRNKKLISYSSRFLDELKTFVWLGEKAQAMKGKHDDLVMALAIGAWLLDTSDSFSNNSAALNKAMLFSMAITRKEYNPPEFAAGRDMMGNPLKPRTPTADEVVGTNTSTRRDMKALRNLKWLLT
jgi:hypothetical protein